MAAPAHDGGKRGLDGTGARRRWRRDRIDTRLIRASFDSARSLTKYLGHVVVDARPEPRSWGLLWEPWQGRLVEPIIPAIEFMAGLRSEYAGRRSFFYVLPKGHDKTGLIGRVANWAVAFSRRRINAAAAAADSDQATLLLDSMKEEVRLNPWMKSRVQTRNSWVYGPGGRLQVLSSDADKWSGLKCDLVVCDEITRWRSKDLFDVLWSGREKRPASVFVIITNAGHRGSWQWDILQAARQQPREWFVFEAPERQQLAGWMSTERIANMRTFLAPSTAAMVLDNIWISPAADNAEWGPEFFPETIWYEPAELPCDETATCTVIACDPSLGASESADDSAIVRATYVAAQRAVFVDASVERRDPVRLARDLVVMVRSSTGAETAIEANGFQSLLRYPIAEECRRQGFDFKIVQVTNSANKLERIRRLAPLLDRTPNKTSAWLRFNRQSAGARRIVDQLQNFPLTKKLDGSVVKRDGADALELAIRRLDALTAGAVTGIRPRDANGSVEQLRVS